MTVWRETAKKESAIPNGFSATVWVRASNYPEVFVGKPVEIPQDPVPEPEPVAQAINFGQAAPATGGHVPLPGSGSNQQWFYSNNGVERGPADFTNLQLLLGTGQLRPEDLVWTQGMTVWMPARDVPGLQRSGEGRSDGTREGDDGGSVKLPDSIYRAAASSKPWATTIAVVLLIYSALHGAFGIWLLVKGAQALASVAVGTGIVMLVQAFIWATAATLLLFYTGQLGRMSYSRAPIVLERALDKLRGFLVFVSIYLIVNLTFLVIVAIYVFAVGITWPGW